MRSPKQLPISEPTERGERRARPGFLPPQESLAGVYAPKAGSADERIEQLEEAVEQQERRLHGMIQIAESLRRSQEPKSAMRDIVTRISELLNADRSTVYQVEESRGMLVGLAVQGETSVEVAVPFGRGLAGLCAQLRRSINLRDAYEHESFDPRFDKLTGYRTQSVLCAPMIDSKGEVIGVVQVLNKKSGYFTLEDQHLLSALATQAAITLETLQLQLQLRRSNKQLKGLSERVQSHLDEQSLLRRPPRPLCDL
ncbi:MAG: GAF domain-containing protein, partial [Myxococcota bacterium]|nr:GAF domain-containing protein [Myxococcota bacterium]